jgi:hypothetical protein
MISNELIRYYENLEQRFSLTFNPDYGNLVAPNGNAGEPIHRWFHVKEGFSSRLLQHVLEDTGLLSRPSLSLLDSFVGGGTTVVSALTLDEVRQNLPVTAYGIERNPFLGFVARTKVLACGFRAPNFREYIENIANLSESPGIKARPLPELSTFHREDYFEAQSLAQLLKLSSAIEVVEGSELERDLAKLCLAGAIEPVSALRRDGRALRYVPGKYQPDVLAEFLRRASIVDADIRKPAPSSRVGHICIGDGRNPANTLPSGARFDLVLFSPPYPNNIDYTEVYKLEAWLLGFINSKASFQNQRFLTLRSHPSVHFPDLYRVNQNGYKKEFYALLNPVLNQIPQNESWLWRNRLVKGYFDDLLETLRNHRQLLADHGYLVFVVGNSLHGCREAPFLIAADLLLARLAEIAGYEVVSFVVARQLKRRGNSPLMRESVVFLRKK